MSNKIFKTLLLILTIILVICSGILLHKFFISKDISMLCYSVITICIGGLAKILANELN